ncbi:centromere-associated protein E [Erinaceus europaeus]|uniref:Centromere-associated protein E n=1 Tax=Erinaceus europaeus TaxID=9365 RepID=A0ABM3VVM1_ERIEU|nr:centromere-associated protein E [Erinaceus europaeus]
MAEEGAVAVCVRVRPLNSREEALGEDTQVYWKTDNNVIYQADGSKSFNFDRVFNSSETTKHVYEEIAVPIIDSAIQGYNGTIFAYGQTASGKTYTMMGSKDYLGVIPRAIHDIFQKIKKFPDREFLLRVSYMEIYNDTITDLLCDTLKMKPLIIREDFNRNVYVSDLTEEVVYTSEMALKCITKGEKNRHYGATKMNQRSSRSHTIFRMILESREKGEPSNCDGSVKVSHLNLVDLAGSERAAQTGAEGVRLKEGCNINRSLFILGQVIKKLSDGQAGGFINYRDSKLTRILQNSLGGNAKTRIICTITPVSYDESLTTLQFASTAKHMKNTPYVNEVSSDEALLKRYRKEIMDLKKQLEEVSLETRAQAMEKDQLAQLLEEKDLLQKVQNEKIQNLTQMLVTSSSLTSQQELKAKKKRRVTWCVGKINKMKDSNYMSEFSMPANVATRTHRATLSSVGEIDESLCSEADVFSSTLDSLADVEWNPATKLLSQETLESELSSLRANYDNLVLDYEELRREREEMESKLKEKKDLDEFEALEKRVEKDQEMQLIHEISNLKNLVKHAEVYNQDLENELSSKIELLKEKEEQIEKLMASQKSESRKAELSESSELTENLTHMKQSLFDAEAIALDSKRESAFLRSENLELKEKMKELSSACSQMEKDIQAYHRQLEAKKKMQVDLERELQSSYSEITKLSSLVDGRVPNDLLSNLELERKITALQKELHKEANENEALRNEIHVLSELKPLPSEVERLQKEIHDKSEELKVVTSEKEKLSCDVAERERRIQGLLEERERTQGDQAAPQPGPTGADQEAQDVGTQHTEAEQKHRAALDENTRMRQAVESLSRELQSRSLSLATAERELSRKTQELEQRTAESQQKLSELEQLKEQLGSGASRLQAVEREKNEVAGRLQEALGEVRALTQEKDTLQQLQESLQTERDQLRSDIQDMVVMNIDTQEQLRNALESLKQQQQTTNTLSVKTATEASSGSLHVAGSTGGAESERQEQDVCHSTRQSLEGRAAPVLAVGVEGSGPADEQRKVLSLVQEKAELQCRLERVTAEKEQLQADLQESIEMTIENQEELRILREELKKQRGMSHSSQEEELSRGSEKLAEIRGELQEKSQRLQESQQRLLRAQAEVSEVRQELEEMENVKGQLQNQMQKLEQAERERLELAQKLREAHEKLEAVTREREELRGHTRAVGVTASQAFFLPRLLLLISSCSTVAFRDLDASHLAVVQCRLSFVQCLCCASGKAGGCRASLLVVRVTAAGRVQEERPGQAPRALLTLTLHKACRLRAASASQKQRLQGEGRDLDPLLRGREAEARTAHALVRGQQEAPGELRQQAAESAAPVTVTAAQQHPERPALESRGEVPPARDAQQQSLSTRGEGSERETLGSVEQSQEPLGAEEVALPGPEGEQPASPVRRQAGQDERKPPAEETGHRRLPKELLSERDQPREAMRELEAKHRETQQELEVTLCRVKEREDAISELRTALSEREREVSSLQRELGTASAELQRKTQELHEKQEQLIGLRGAGEAQERVSELKQLRERLTAAESSLHSSQAESLRLAQRIQEGQQEVATAMRERDELRREREGLRGSLKEAVAEIQEHRLLQTKAAGEAQDRVNELESMKRQLEAQKSALKSTDTEKAELTQKLQDGLEEMRRVLKEADELRSTEKALRAEKEQLEQSLKAAALRELEKQEELAGSLKLLKGHQAAQEELRADVSEKTHLVSSLQTDLEHTISVLEAQTQELQEREHRLREVESHLKENVREAAQLREQLKAKSSALESTAAEKLRLTQNLQESLGAIACLTEERDGLRRTEETAVAERDQLRAQLQRAEAMVQELQASQHQDASERQKNTTEIEQLREQVKDQSVTLNRIEMENLNFAQKLHHNIEELKSVTKERDNLKTVEEALSLERDQLRDSLRETTARDLETQQQLKMAHQRLKEHQETIDRLRERVSEKTSQMPHVQKGLNKSTEELREKAQQDHGEAVTCGEGLPCDGANPTVSLREKCLRIKELLKQYPELYPQHACLGGLSLDVEEEVQVQKELSARIKEKLALHCAQAGSVHKLLAKNLSCSMEFLRVLEKVQYVLDNVTTIKEEHHGALCKLEAGCVGEVERQAELLDGGHGGAPGTQARALTLGQKLDQHIEEIVRDFSGSDFPSIKAELEAAVSNSKDMTRFLRECLATHADTEKLTGGLQQAIDRMYRVNYLYGSRMIAMMNESTAFEESHSALAKQWEQELKSLKEENRELLKTRQPPGALPYTAAARDAGQPRAAVGATQQAAEAMPGPGAQLHGAGESAAQKERPGQAQKELEAARGVISKLQRRVEELDQHLLKAKEMNQALQDRVSLGAQPYREQLEDLKMQLVKTDLDKKQRAKEFEKEMASVKAAVDHQKEVIRVLKEELRRSQSSQDTSMTLSEPPHKPWTCGGGSGVVQSTKALILKSEYARLEKENSRLRRQNERLLRQQDALAGGTQHPAPEVTSPQERTLRRVVRRERPSCENTPPESPGVPAATKKRPHVSSPCQERAAPAPGPLGSPRAKSLPAPPTRFFDNSGLGLCPEPQVLEDESEPPAPDAQLANARAAPECRVQ